MTVSRIALTAALGTTATASFAQPDAWSLLKQIEIDEVVTATTYEVRKSFPKALESAQDGVQITGYAVPALPGEKVRELLLVSDMGLCPFCGNTDHGASLLVSLAEPIDAVDEAQRITLRGTLEPVTDPETWQAAILKNATIVTD